MTAVAFAQQEFNFPPAPAPRLEPVVSLVPRLSLAPANTPRLNVPVVRHRTDPRHRSHGTGSAAMRTARVARDHSVNRGDHGVHPATAQRPVWVLRGVLGVAIAVLVVTGLFVVASDGGRSLSGLPTATAALPVAGASAVDPSVAVHVVQPGDTLWSIAAAVAPGSDPRPIVDELARRSGGAGLQPGQHIALDGLVR